ncbi:helix-turn-helix domain-containing protein [Frankia sp. R82]|uniref:winged helix-turn-helix transcriptional regulator n=1 Tax=Frankia sp. R82 TaxID=2950553 RepID=UPI0020448137|nr:helix-turn-helix domain-containing protein [Frankia sp. R82]MCM3887562.1 helix-turn-helix transcriptional regulator [Frankia sp. R82]
MTALSGRIDPVCPSEITPIRVGDKWTALILTLLADGPLRFRDLRGHIGPVTGKVLTVSLRGLERNGFIARTESPGPPRAVIYGITALGRTLLPSIAMARDWAEEHMTAMLDARQAYDNKYRGATAAS